MYGKIHEDIYDSTLMSDLGPEAVYIFIGMIVMADHEGCIRKDARALWRRLGLDETDWCPFDKFMDLIEKLEAPDELSNLADYEGRRLIPLHTMDHIDGSRGWFIPTYEHYRQRGSKEDRKTQNRLNKQAQRQRESADVSNGQQSSAMSSHTDTDTDTDIITVDANASTGRRAPPADPVPYQKIVDLWHEILPELPRTVALSPARKSKIRARWKNGMNSLNEWELLFQKIRQSRFLMGLTEPGPNRTKPFLATLEWVTKEENFLKILEGRYHGKSQR